MELENTLLKKVLTKERLLNEKKPMDITTVRYYFTRFIFVCLNDNRRTSGSFRNVNRRNYVNR